MADSPVSQERVEFIGCELRAAIRPKLYRRSSAKREERPDSVDDLAGGGVFVWKWTDLGPTTEIIRQD